MQKRTLLVGFILASAITALLNTSFFIALENGPYIARERRVDARDEDYYLALVQEASEGHTNLGNVSLKEHRDDPTIVTHLPLVYSTIMKYTGLPRWQVLLFLNLLCPFLLTFIFFLGLQRIGKSQLETAILTFFIINIWQSSLLSVINPKLIVLLMAIYISLYFGISKPKLWHFALRGLLLAILLYAYPHFFLFCAVLEACDFFRRAYIEREKTKGVKELVTLSFTFLLFGWKIIIGMLLGVNNEAAIDLWNRIVIPSHLPAAPFQQLMLIGVLLILFWIRSRSRKRSTTHIDLSITTLITGILILNQSVLHGLELNIGLHYLLLLWVFLWIAFFVIINETIGKRSFRIGILVLICFVTIPSFAMSLVRTHLVRLETAAAFEASEKPKIIEWLNTQEGEQVILAPMNIANLIPAFTHHYVAMNGYATFQSVTDDELAKRYVLMEMVDPQLAIDRDESFEVVFSVHAGNRAARARTLCRIRSGFKKSPEECEVPISSMILHQDVLKRLQDELESMDPRMLLDRIQEFHVDFIVATTPLPNAILDVCKESIVIEKYTIYQCIL